MRTAAGKARGQPGERAAAQAQEQERSAEPEQRRREEHVHRERQRRVRVRVHHRREAGARGQPVDEPRDRECDQVEIQPLPEWRADAPHAAPALGDAAAEGDEPGADARGRRARRCERNAEAEGCEDAAGADSPTAAGETDGG